MLLNTLSCSSFTPKRRRWSHSWVSHHSTTQFSSPTVTEVPTSPLLLRAPKKRSRQLFEESLIKDKSFSEEGEVTKFNQNPLKKPKKGILKKAPLEGEGDLLNDAFITHTHKVSLPNLREDVLMLNARIKANKGCFLDAFEEIKNIREHSNPSLLYLTSELYLNLGQFEKAQNSINKALLLSPGNEKYQLLKKDIIVSVDKYKESIKNRDLEYFNRRVQNATNTKHQHFFLVVKAHALVQMSLLNEALASINEAILLQQSRISIQLKAQILFCLKRFDETLDTLKGLGNHKSILELKLIVLQKSIQNKLPINGSGQLWLQAYDTVNK
jgi:tetratricopeptide (TPR) repeat protein